MSVDPNASHGRPRFQPTEHLASEAVAAYVDGELRMNAYLRAAQHISLCPECAYEVDAQQTARIALRRAAQAGVDVPRGLHDSLTRIPLAELPQNSPEPPRRNEAILGFLTDSFTATRWTTWRRK
ncbi:hypothetical protein [Nocardia camponoti]|uniref:RNA polymerase subunit sigma-70 n=1 Tax=Nocardia camponoti TaxID=1616106 RepID=A0A917QF02_9NOCA|nr:hypothetical protein [Nocardia camponoti]GGK47503.1 hypothetical protein GCM10011591_18540 [Nocardia camponoti]